MLYKCFDKKYSGGGIKNENMLDQLLAEKSHKPIIRKLKEQSLYSPFVDNICGVDLADIQLIYKFNKGLSFYHVALIF